MVVYVFETGFTCIFSTPAPAPLGSQLRPLFMGMRHYWNFRCSLSAASDQHTMHKWCVLCGFLALCLKRTACVNIFLTTTRTQHRLQTQCICLHQITWYCSTVQFGEVCLKKAFFMLLLFVRFQPVQMNGLLIAPHWIAQECVLCSCMIQV